MRQLLFVGLGGGMGALARYKLSLWLLSQTPLWRFPAGTFVVNVLGCLVAGLLAGWMERRGAWGADVQLLVFTGILGGFTTFSAFGLETVQLLRRGEIAVAAVYVLLSVSAGLAALWIAMKLSAR